jgi:nucleoside-diphosphate-sugar epimerase
LVDNAGFDKVFLYDKENIKDKESFFRKNFLKNYSQIEYVHGDITDEILWMPNEKVTLVANFAAVHREPGHENNEYYECNIPGAENVCSWVDKVKCSKLIFSSSIAPYGPSEAAKCEESIPTPETAYGGSKLAAEKIHQIWHASNKANQLVVVRPGVVFGPGEGGNVSRLIKAVSRRYFFYMSNQNTRKAGVYVKELCLAMTWTLNKTNYSSNKFVLFNMTMNPGPSIKDYVDAISEVQNKFFYVPNMPSSFLYFICYIVDFVAKPFKIQHPFSPVRVKKLTRSNDIIPNYLINNNYKFKYNLITAFKDWKEECPDEWL